MTYKQIFFLVTFILLFSCKKKVDPIYFEEKGEAFKTSYNIKYKFTRSLKTEIDKRLQEFDDSLNPFKTSSVISKVNNNESVILDSLFLNVLNRSLEISTLSGGLFDVTVSPLINAWGFGFKNMDSINHVIIDSLSQFVGYHKISIMGDKIIKDDPRVNINTSAIAKGYSVDIIAYLLESYGIHDYKVEIGGEIRTKGLNSKNKCWRIAVTKPMKKNSFDYSSQNTQVVIKLCNKSLATSGNYYNYYVKDGKKLSHTIDPRTGYPSDNNVLSATVIADDCMSADAFATVFMLADTTEIRRIAKKEGLSYMLITSIENSDNFEIIESDDFKSYILY